MIPTKSDLWATVDQARAAHAKAGSGWAAVLARLLCLAVRTAAADTALRFVAGGRVDRLPERVLAEVAADLPGHDTLLPAQVATLLDPGTQANAWTAVGNTAVTYAVCADTALLAAFKHELPQDVLTAMTAKAQQPPDRFAPRSSSACITALTDAFPAELATAEAELTLARSAQRALDAWTMHDDLTAAEASPCAPPAEVASTVASTADTAAAWPAATTRWADAATHLLATTLDELLRANPPAAARA